MKGWAFNEQGILETDSEIAVKNLLLVPLGGLENTAGYKGYGLACMVEIFCGILSGEDVFAYEFGDFRTSEKNQIFSTIKLPSRVFRFFFIYNNLNRYKCNFQYATAFLSKTGKRNG